MREVEITFTWQRKFSAHTHSHEFRLTYQHKKIENNIQYLSPYQRFAKDLLKFLNDKITSGHRHV